MSDSQGIFFVDLPGVYTSRKDLSDNHGKDLIGILVRGPPLTDSAVAETCESDDEDSDERERDPPERRGGFDIIEENVGPGMRLTTLFPKERAYNVTSPSR